MIENFMVALSLLSGPDRLEVSANQRDLFCAQVSSVHTRVREAKEEYAVTFINGKNATLSEEGFHLAREALIEGLFLCVSNTNPPIYSLSRSTNLR